MKNLVIIGFLLLLSCVENIDLKKYDWYGQQTIYCLALFEKRDGQQYAPHGTGFVIGPKTEPDTSGFEKVFIVTNRHVLKRKFVFISVPIDTVFLSSTPEKDEEYLELDGQIWTIKRATRRLRTKMQTVIDGKQAYVAHPDTNLDIAVFVLKVPTLIVKDSTDEGIDLAFKRIIASNVGFLGDITIGQNIDVRLGATAYVVGFPACENLPYPEVTAPGIRSGSIAWINPTGVGFRIDTTILNGNSGSPVFIREEKKTKGDYLSSKLVGMVHGHKGLKKGVVTRMCG